MLENKPWEIAEDKSNINEVIEYNKKLIAEYPFLKPYNEWTGKDLDNYDYTWTWADDIPEGWRIAFGDEFLKEIKNSLINSNRLEEYHITQIKEKYGSLRWYDCGGPRDLEYEIIPKYEKISMKTCINCGAPATKLSVGWIEPYCDFCVEKIKKRVEKHNSIINFEDIGNEKI